MTGSSQTAINTTLEDPAAAARERDRLGRLLFSSGGILIVSSPEGIMERINRNGCLLLGYEEGDLIGRSLKSVFLDDEEGDDGGFLPSEFQRMIQCNSFSTVERSLRTRDGSFLPVILSCTAVHDPRGFLEGVVCFAHDLSGCRKVEKALRKSLDEKEREAKEEHLRSLEMRKELLDRGLKAAVADLSEMLLHNVGNSIMPMKAYLELLNLRKLEQMVQYLGKSFDELTAHHTDLQHFIEEDDRGGAVWNYLSRLIASFGEYTQQSIRFKDRIETSMDRAMKIFDLRRDIAVDDEGLGEPVDVGEVLMAAERLLEGALASRNIDLQYRLEPNLPRVLVNRTCLLVIVARLVQSSYRALEKDETAGRQAIEFVADCEDGLVTIDVRDNRVPHSSPEEGRGSEDLIPSELCRYATLLESVGGTLTSPTDLQEQGVTIRRISVAVAFPSPQSG